MLDHFPRPPGDNGRGVHWSHSQYFWGKEDWGFWKDQIQAMNLKWIKLLDDGGGSVMGLIKRLVDIKVMPVVRFYREEPNPGRISAREVETAKRYAELGAVYFETNNEPDLDLEWEDRYRPPNWLEIVVDNFIIEADMIREVGGYLLFPAFGPGGRGNPFKLIVDKGRKDLLDGNCCLAIHNYCLGRPLDYPNDSINTQGAPLTQAEWEDRGGMWAWEMGYETVNEHRRRLANPNATIMEDSTCFRAFEYFDALVNEAAGHSIPIFTTEGGYNVGQRAGTTFGDDPRYPKPTPEWASRLTDEMFRQMEEEVPAYYFACMPWLIAVNRMGIWGDAFENQGPWFTHHFDKQFGLNGELPLVDMLKARPGTVRQDGPVPEGFKTFYTGPDLTGRNFDDRFKYLEPQVLLEPVADSSQPYWRLIEARWADEKEAQGRGYIYVKALDSSGQPLEGATFQADRGDAIDRVETKGAIDQYWGNYMMTATLGTYRVSMAQDELSSDILTNLGLGNEISPQDFVRTSFYLTFQQMAGDDAGGVEPPEVEVPVEPPPPLEPEVPPEPPSDLPARKLDERFKQLNPPVLLEPVTNPSQAHWRLVEGRWADQQEAGGRAYVYVKALDERGQPIEGATFQADRGDAVDKAETKGAIDQYWGNYMMTGTVGTYKISMAEDNLPSDTLVNVGFGDGETPFLSSFFLTFQKIPEQTTPPNPDRETAEPSPPPSAGPHVEPPEERIEAAPQLEEAILRAAGQYIIPVNRQSRLYQYAQMNNLGQFLSAEFPVQYQGSQYRVQVFAGGFVYLEAGHDLVKHIPFEQAAETVENSPAGAGMWGWFRQLVGWQ